MALRVKVTSLDDALDWAERQGVPVPDAVKETIQKKATEQAQIIAATSKLNLSKQVQTELSKAVQSGQSFADWKKAVADGEITPQELPKGVKRTIFQTSLQQSYNAGRWQAFAEDKGKKPFLMFSAINDNRTTEICKALHGTIRRIDDPFWENNSPAMHFNSILPGNRVSGKVYSALKARYSGPAVEITGKSGNRVSVTAQHPVLTGNGWVHAGDLTEGMNLISYNGIVSGGPMSANHNKDNLPPKIEEVFEALRVGGCATAPRASLNLHGDEVFIQGDVDVVTADRSLMRAYKTHIFEQKQDLLFTLAGQAARELPSYRPLSMGVFGRVSPRASYFAVLASIVWAKMFYSGSFSINDDPGLSKESSEPFSAHVKFLADLLHRNPGLIQGDGLAWDFAHEIGSRDPSHFVGAPLNAFVAGTPSDPRIIDVPVGTANTNPDLFRNISNIHPGLIEPDSIVSLRRFDFSGHVYDLHTKAGVIITCNGGRSSPHYLVSNCRSTLIQMTWDEARRRSGSNTGLFAPKPTVAAPEGFGTRPDTREGYELKLLDKLTLGLLSVPAKIGNAISKLFGGL